MSNKAKLKTPVFVEDIDRLFVACGIERRKRLSWHIGLDVLTVSSSFLTLCGVILKCNSVEDFCLDQDDLTNALITYVAYSVAILSEDPDDFEDGYVPPKQTACDKCLEASRAISINEDGFLPAVGGLSLTVIRRLKKLPQECIFLLEPAR